MNTRQICLALALLAPVLHAALFAAENILPVAAAVPVVSPGKPTDAASAAAKPAAKARPKFQYQSEGIEVPAATADEPKVKAFGPDTIRAARKYLDDGWKAGETKSHNSKRHFMALPAYDQCIKASHVFNLLDARGVISVTERQSYILRVRELAKACGEAWLKTEAGGSA